MNASQRFCMPALLLVTASSCLAQQNTSNPVNALVIPFAIAGTPSLGDAIAGKACPATAEAIAADMSDDAQKVVTAIAQEMQTALAQHGTATISRAGQAPVSGMLVFSGCLTGLKRGSAAARSISIGAGGSQITTHVRVYRAGPDGAETDLHEYDLVTKGTNYGGGLLVGLARAKRTSVEGDGKHAADQIVEKYFAEAGVAAK